MTGVRYRLLYPAKLLVTHGDVRKSFTDPKETVDYAEKHLSHPPSNVLKARIYLYV